MRPPAVHCSPPAGSSTVTWGALALRVRRLQEQDGLSLEEAQKKIRERDLSDVEWIKRYFGLDSHEPSLFDVIINTAKYTPADAADLVIKALAVLPKTK